MQASNENMLKSQIQCFGATNPKTLDIMQSVDRGSFVPEAYKHLTYADLKIPLGTNPSEVMLEPKICGRIIETLCLNFTTIENCLVVGSGSGYLTALIANMCNNVIGYEISQDLYQQSLKNLHNIYAQNIKLINDNGLSFKLDEVNKFDCIVLTAAAEFLPTTIGDKLTKHGQIIAFIGKAPVVTMQIITKLPSGAWNAKSLFDTFIPQLDCLPSSSNFNF